MPLQIPVLPGDWANLNRRLLDLERLRNVLDTGGVTAGVRFGTVTVTHTAATQGTATVTHGLGRVPAVILATVLAGADGTAYTASVFAPNDTTFGVVTTRSPAFSADLTVYWMVVG